MPRKRGIFFITLLALGFFWINFSFGQKKDLHDRFYTPSPNKSIAYQNSSIIFLEEFSEDQNLCSALLEKGIPQQEVCHILLNLLPLFDLKSTKIQEDQYIITLDAGKKIKGASPLSEIDRTEQEVNDTYLVLLSGEVEDSIYAGINKITKTKKLAHQFIDIFAWKIDFRKDARRNDRFNLLVEKYYQGEEFIDYGRILAAEYDGSRTGKHEAFYYQEDELIEDYYSPWGLSLRAKAPLSYSCISSGYTNRRLHPLLKVIKPHLGIDFAAPSGTPVWAVEKGEVIYKNFDCFNGNQILIEHRDGYISYYNHLSRFADTIKAGDKVKQRQIIGFVGSTGLSTGPHLDYRLKKGKKFINPLKVDFPFSSHPMVKDRYRFNQIKEIYSFLLQNGYHAEKGIIASGLYNKKNKLN